MTLTLERSPFTDVSSPVDLIPGYFVFNVAALSDYLCKNRHFLILRRIKITITMNLTLKAIQHRSQGNKGLYLHENHHSSPSRAAIKIIKIFF